MKMTIPYNVTGKQRKQLAEDISVALHTIPKYLGYPTCNYNFYIRLIFIFLVS